MPGVNSQRLPDDPEADFNADELSLIFVSVAISPKAAGVAFGEDEIERDALEVAAKLMVPFLNGDDFKAEELRQSMRQIRAELRKIEKANEQEEPDGGGD